MGKKQSAPKPDYGSLWRSYDKWQQEDRMWYEGKKAEYEKGADVGATKARMASSGLKEGSEAWKRGLAGVMAGRQDIDKAYADKQKDLQESLVYKDLQKEYTNQENRREGRARDAFVRGIGTEVSRMGNEWGENTSNERARDIWRAFGGHEKNEYGGDYTPNQRELGNRVFGDSEGGMSDIIAKRADLGSLGFDFQKKAFEEWGKGEFGSEQAENPYAEKGPTPEELAEMRAKQHASGRQKGAGIQQGIDAMTEESPWM